MILKKENPKSKMRTKLLKRLLELDLSTKTKLIVVSKLGNMTDEQKEEEASRILNLITSCKNEADVLEKLSIQ